MNCGCEYGEHCSKVSVCFMEQRVSDEKYDLQEIIDGHSEFVRAVRSNVANATVCLDPANSLAFMHRILDLCDAELAKEEK